MFLWKCATTATSLADSLAAIRWLRKLYCIGTESLGALTWLHTTMLGFAQMWAIKTVLQQSQLSLTFTTPVKAMHGVTLAVPPCLIGDRCPHYFCSWLPGWCKLGHVERAACLGTARTPSAVAVLPNITMALEVVQRMWSFLVVFIKISDVISETPDF